MQQSLPKITIFGAGCIGCYLAGVLYPAFEQLPHKLTLVGRLALLDAIREKGLKISDYLGLERNISGPINLISEPKKQSTECADVLLITVKCTAIATSLHDMAPYIDNNTLIICLQNGIGSEQPLIQAYPQNKVLTGVVGFNSLALSPTHYHRGTSGSVEIEADENVNLAALMRLFKQQQLPAMQVDNIEQVRWGKLLLNLNNCLNALSGIPLKQQLSERAYRQLLARAMSETLQLLKRANIKPAKMTRVAPFWLPVILALPNALFKRLANKMLAIDPLARSSMWHDIMAQRITEIDFINGAVLDLGQALAIQTPVNHQLVTLIKQAETAAVGSPRLSAAQLQQKINLPI